MTYLIHLLTATTILTYSISTQQPRFLLALLPIIAHAVLLKIIQDDVAKYRYADIHLDRWNNLLAVNLIVMAYYTTILTVASYSLYLQFN